MNQKEQKFVRTVWEYYESHGRHGLPWRNVTNPYRILVSEIMLQQTQVDRVLPKYSAFLKQFPTCRALSRASLGDVLRAWQGLGYNRRAKMLHACTQRIAEDHHGKFPCTHEALVALPGIGHYTAGAIMAFAYNSPVPIIETNIRSVILHHFFHDATDVHDRAIMEVVERTLQHDRVRAWYYALMDYGVYIKKEFGNPNSKSTHYTKQSAFKGSDREIRGAILRLLGKGGRTRQALLTELPFEDVRIDAQVEKLLREGLIEEVSKKYQLPT
jgi:A/G-specific adenine glycosylase